MIRPVLTGTLALTCVACAARPSAVGPEAFGNQEGRQSGVEPDSSAKMPPRLLNPEQVNRALTQEYPTALKEAGIGGITMVRLFVDEEGVVRDQVVAESSGHAMLDRAALRVARYAWFTPANVGGEPVALWIEVPITFTPGQVHQQPTWLSVGGSDPQEQAL